MTAEHIMHAALAPSSMARTIQCAASVTMTQRFPEDAESESAREGRAAHKIATDLVLGHGLPKEGSITPEGIEVTAEMLDGAEMFAGYVESEDGLAHVESRVDCSVLHPQCWGTPDYWYYDKPTGDLSVVDYKFGHKFVEVFENWQLLTYLAGILSEIEEVPKGINLVIVQPRSYHREGPIRTWNVPLERTERLFERISKACHKAMEPYPLATTGPECDYCPARHACSVIQAKASRGMELVGQPHPTELSPVAASSELRMLWNAMETLKARASGLEEVCLRAATKGTKLPGLKLESSKGRTGWTVPISEVVALGKMLGVELEKPGVITPTQAQKAGLSEEVVKSFSAAKDGKVSLVPDTGISTRKAFQP